MLFTRTIRRTMVCGLAMVLIMMIGLLLSAIYSHLSYRHYIHELDDAFNGRPRQQKIVEALVDLKGPLLWKLKPSQKAHEARASNFRAAIRNAQSQINDFLHKTDRLRQYSELDPSLTFARDVAIELYGTLDEMERRAQALSNPALPPHALNEIQVKVDELQVRARGIPDFQEGIHPILQEALGAVRRGLWLVAASGAVAVLFFCGLIVYGYAWVFAPLRKLHQGARRVAQGDFNYRLDLSRQDEMKELADAFNSMTSRFQEIRGDLDRQVCERIKQLIRSERLAGIGLLAAGVAHEINNPLSAVAMAAESLADRMSDSPVAAADGPQAAIVQQYLQMIQSEAFRCQKITQKLLDFARGNNETCARHDLTAIVHDVLAVIRHMSRYADKEIIFKQTNSCFLEMNGPEIQQVVMNLVSNGLEAMDAGGKMTIEITEQTDQITLTVSDDGCGMTAEVIENLFEPFFTQRRHGRGTGLGLSITHRIVSDHGGTIEAESEGPDCGSAFRLHLPRRAVKRQSAA